MLEGKKYKHVPTVLPIIAWFIGRVTGLMKYGSVTPVHFTYKTMVNQIFKEKSSFRSFSTDTEQLLNEDKEGKALGAKL